MSDDDYIELTDPKEIIGEGDGITFRDSPWRPVTPGLIGTQVGEHPSGFRFRRPRASIIRDEAIYSDPVKFSSTNNYGCGPDDENDVYTIEEFKEKCRRKMFVDSDGFGQPVKDGKAANINIWPSTLDRIPSDATHIVWFNK